MGVTSFCPLPTTHFFYVLSIYTQLFTKKPSSPFSTTTVRQNNHLTIHDHQIKQLSNQKREPLRAPPHHHSDHHRSNHPGSDHHRSNHPGPDHSSDHNGSDHHCTDNKIQTGTHLLRRSVCPYYSSSGSIQSCLTGLKMSIITTSLSSHIHSSCSTFDGA